LLLTVRSSDWSYSSFLQLKASFFGLPSLVSDYGDKNPKKCTSTLNREEIGGVLCGCAAQNFPTNHGVHSLLGITRWRGYSYGDSSAHTDLDNFVRLEPLSLKHVSGLADIGLDESIWRFMLYGKMQSVADVHAWVEDMLRRQAAGADLPFAVRHVESGRLAGATRYLDIRPNTALSRSEAPGTVWNFSAPL
jgi:hypothetical protein